MTTKKTSTKMYTQFYLNFYNWGRCLSKFSKKSIDDLRIQYNVLRLVFLVTIVELKDVAGRSQVCLYIG